MAAEKHIIKKAIVEIYIPSANNAMDLQNKAMVFFKEKICPLIEKIVERYSRPGETIRIEKLELDFEKFNPLTTSDTDLRKLEEQIEQKLIKLISEERADNMSGEILSDVKKIPKEKADEELFFHLLKTGTLPWWAKTEEPIALEALSQKILNKPSDSFQQEFISILVNPAVRKRIAYQLSAKSVGKLISVANPAAVDILVEVEKLHDFIKDNFVSSDNIRASFYEYILRDSKSTNFSLQLFIERYLKEKNDFNVVQKIYTKSNQAVTNELVLTIKEALVAVDDFFDGEIKKIFTANDLKAFFGIWILEKSGKSKNADKVESLEKPKKAVESEDVEKLTMLKKSKTTEKSKTPGKSETADNSKNVERRILDNELNELETYQGISEKQKIEIPDTLFLNEGVGDYFIKNSGIIILAPYLPMLFKALELSDGKAFISEEAKERAVYLLHYLTTGNDSGFEEHEMVLNKILCEVGIFTPLISQFVITEREKEECAGLLQAVADNWSALKGTSGEGMRDAFFMRDGILEQQSNGWNLKIEKTTIDILLDKLPWGISIIQMPWSKEMIFVEW